MASVASRLLPLGVAPIEKMTFDACGEPSVASAIGSRAPSAIVMAGVEAHVCVFQTARTLVERGYAVHVLVDAVASRDEANRAAGIALCERAGAVSTVTEAVVFDWLERGGTDAFRAISKLVR
jgi:nicotinamidase-related amidase